MPKYVIHIGPTKTGSKYLQSKLYHSRPLLQKLGVSYPDIWWITPYQISHEPLLILLRQRRYAEVKESFRQINDTEARIVVLSCEAFDDLSRNN